MNPYCPLHLEFIFTWNKLLLIQYYYWQVQLLPILNYFIARLINVFLFSPSLLYLYNFYYQETFSSLVIKHFFTDFSCSFSSLHMYIYRQISLSRKSIYDWNVQFLQEIIIFLTDQIAVYCCPRGKKMRCWHWIPWKTLFDYFSDFVVEKDTESMSFMCGRSLRECSL